MYTQDDLLEAKRQIESTLHKLQKTKMTLESKENSERYTSQITLASRRIDAFGLALHLVERELDHTQ